MVNGPKLPKTREGAVRRYNALIRQTRRDLRGGLQFGLDERTLLNSFPERAIEISAIRESYKSLPYSRAVEFELVWSPEGRVIAVVKARSAKAAKRLTPKPWRQYRGEVYAREKTLTDLTTVAPVYFTHQK